MGRRIPPPGPQQDYSPVFLTLLSMLQLQTLLDQLAYRNHPAHCRRLVKTALKLRDSLVLHLGTGNFSSIFDFDYLDLCLPRIIYVSNGRNGYHPTGVCTPTRDALNLLKLPTFPRYTALFMRYHLPGIRRLELVLDMFTLTSSFIGFIEHLAPTLTELSIYFGELPQSEVYLTKAQLGGRKPYFLKLLKLINCSMPQLKHLTMEGVRLPMVSENSQVNLPVLAQLETFTYQSNCHAGMYVGSFLLYASLNPSLRRISFGTDLRTDNFTAFLEIPDELAKKFDHLLVGSFPSVLALIALFRKFSNLKSLKLGNQNATPLPEILAALKFLPILEVLHLHIFDTRTPEVGRDEVLPTLRSIKVLKIFNMAEKYRIAPSFPKLQNIWLLLARIPCACGQNCLPPCAARRLPFVWKESCPEIPYLDICCYY